ncbi:hypothetical protein QEH56_10845 [Pelagicoccus enzymogenes]|uniref:hypothetical protein n=1 Tax=Pelagicoccus enzymogenes TaxID=2773457 RepID=UPI0028107FD3|nr:hypothetical protein [Pelagicoccus enzymogenes]MDQ8198650.1 hypothetical protein [Pelagicoccus enzymogenes]
MKRFITPLALAIVSPSIGQTLYHESNGIVIMEAENTASPLGQWIKESSDPNFTGEGYLRFDGNIYTHGPAISPLEYQFRIHTPGLYYLQLRCAETNQTIDGEHRDDVSNDCYVRVDGDYEASPEAGNNHTDDAPLSLLKSNTKFFGGKNDGSFVWQGGYENNFQGRLDPGGHQNKRVAIYNFKAGETYTLVIHGRSKAFKIDRIAFNHAELPDSAVRSLTLAETVTPPTTALEEWRMLHFGTKEGTGNAASTFDANRDGESNLLEFATGQDPFATTVAEKDISINGETIELRYSRALDAVESDLLFTVFWSETLHPESWSTAGVSQFVEQQSDGIQTVLATIPMEESKRRLARLSVSE